MLGTFPAIMGQSMASFVLCALAEQPLRPEPVPRMSQKTRHKYYQALRQRELATHGKAAQAACPDHDLIEFAVQYVWRGRCAVTGERNERFPCALTRWDATKPAVADNLVLMKKHLADQLDEGGPAALKDVADAVKAKIVANLGCFADVDEWR